MIKVEPYRSNRILSQSIELLSSGTYFPRGTQDECSCFPKLLLISIQMTRKMRVGRTYVYVVVSVTCFFNVRHVLSTNPV